MVNDGIGNLGSANDEIRMRTTRVDREARAASGYAYAVTADAADQFVGKQLELEQATGRNGNIMRAAGNILSSCSVCLGTPENAPAPDFTCPVASEIVERFMKPVDVSNI
jgi:hypothetical protein